jgi:hypothetical protein
MEPATFRLVAQCLKQLLYRVPQIILSTDGISDSGKQREPGERMEQIHFNYDI